VTTALRDRFGVVSAHLKLYPVEELEREMDAMAGAGIGWLRCDFAWCDLEPTRGAWDLTAAERVVTEARAHGIRILGILGGSPPWANGGHDWSYPPTDTEAWKTYVSTMAATFRGRVSAWEVCNEENIEAFWKPAPDSAAYVSLLAQTSGQIRTADPGAKVVMGGVAGLDPEYLNQCLDAGATDYIDAIAYHPYPETLHQDDYTPQEQRCRDAVGFVRWLVSQHTTRRLEVWLTEIGWTTCSQSPPGVDTGTQAAYMLRSLLNYGGTDADMVFWYNLRDEQLNEYDNYGLRYNDGSEKPSYRYFKCFEREFGGASADVPGAIAFSCSRPDTLEAHSFATPDGSLSLSAWKSDDAADSVTVTVNGYQFDDSTLVDPSSGTARPAPSFTRDASGSITIHDLPVGKTPVIIKFDALTVPRITSISPAGGKAGTPVTVEGTSFGSSRRDSFVTFNGKKAGVYGGWSNSRMTVEAPAGVSSGPVKVTTGLGTSNGVRFTVESPPPEQTEYPDWYLAEGSTAWGFDTMVSIENPQAQALTARITFQTTSGPVRIPDIPLAPDSLTCVDPRAYLGASDFSTRVECLQGRTIAVERSMTWRGQGSPCDGAHSSIGVTTPATRWFLPEGSSAWGFECWLLVQNPGDRVAHCNITYMTDAAGPAIVERSIPANSRASFNIAEDIGAADASIEVQSDVPVITERAMYTPGRREGHDSVGTTAASDDFFLAEGTTAWGFTTYVLIQNPNRSAANVTLTYMTGEGPREQPPVSLPPNSRKTIRVNDTLPPSDFSTMIHSDRPIIAERAMYWDNGTGRACHDSIGVASPHRNFYLPGGAVGGSGRLETWTLVQNAGSSEVRVRVSYLAESGGRNLEFDATIPARSRKTFDMADRLREGRAAVMVECLSPGQGIIAEMATYSRDRGSGTDTVGGFSD
jgi:hypothetical protein